MEMRVCLSFIEIGCGGAKTLGVDYTEGRLKAEDVETLTGMVSEVVSQFVGPSQHNGSKIAILDTFIDGVKSMALSAAAVLTNDEMLAIERRLLQQLQARLG